MKPHPNASYNGHSSRLRCITTSKSLMSLLVVLIDAKSLMVTSMAFHVARDNAHFITQLIAFVAIDCPIYVLMIR
jgi:hypothetical protein